MPIPPIDHPHLSREPPAARALPSIERIPPGIGALPPADDSDPPTTVDVRLLPAAAAAWLAALAVVRMPALVALTCAIAALGVAAVGLRVCAGAPEHVPGAPVRAAVVP
ncbi:hypothetical protein, partial [Cellulomonas sp. P5_C6]